MGLRLRLGIILSVYSLFCLFPEINVFGSDEDYWIRPIAQQGVQDIKSIYPDVCGKCHKEQYDGWKGSLHSKAVGPGLLGQLYPEKDPQFAESCYFCHAPMMEQSEVRSQGPAPAGIKRGSGVGIEKNRYFDNKLKLAGVSCSVCHLREGKVYGPPARKTASSKKQDNHNGFIEKDFFEKAEFCAACHQLDEGYEFNDKLLVNTYREWQESIYGQNKVTCQNCHMPDRQHRWRGIHDKETVLRGISIEAVQHEKEARLIITNSGVGHYFPTYATPLVVVRGFMLDKKGKVIQGSLKEAFIGRKLRLDLSEEIFDTRIAPQKSFEFDYSARSDYSDKQIAFEIWVYPDEFYNKFYGALLKSNNLDLNRKEIEKAFKATANSGYMLFKKIL